MRKVSFGTSLGVKGLSLAMILTSSFFPTRANHTKNSIANPSAPGAIGIIQAAGVVTINGHLANGNFTLWGDEVVQATAGAKIIFGALGEVNLSPGASVQLQMENAKLHEAAGTQAFAANLLAGEMSVKLHTEAGALVNSVDSEFTTSKGATFKVDLKHGRAMVLTGNGTVLANSKASSGRPTESASATTTTKKDTQYLATKKLEKLIGNFKLSVPNTEKLILKALKCSASKGRKNCSPAISGRHQGYYSWRRIRSFCLRSIQTSKKSRISCNV